MPVASNRYVGPSVSQPYVALQMGHTPDSNVSSYNICDWAIWLNGADGFIS